ncbi:hypothetical protein GQ607_016672 [Colletotrichum asianum]|uniref:Uncharacterized protein n=1 Tax=Colletotrichum asianum TaxID=702518 RepID=A0A8H3VVE6_9PEZI|nr:hypothetical protein GQ607_016672 [Colletotrichum asianum]
MIHCGYKLSCAKLTEHRSITDGQYSDTDGQYSDTDGQYSDVGRADKYVTKRPIDPMKPPINSPRAGTQPPPTHTDTRKIKTSLLVFNKRTKRMARTYKKGWEEDYMGKMATEASSIAKANARREGQAKPFSRIPRPARTLNEHTEMCLTLFEASGVLWRTVPLRESHAIEPSGSQQGQGFRRWNVGIQGSPAFFLHIQSVNHHPSFAALAPDSVDMLTFERPLVWHAIDMGNTLVFNQIVKSLPHPCANFQGQLLEKINKGNANGFISPDAKASEAEDIADEHEDTVLGSNSDEGYCLTDKLQKA